MNSYDRRVGLLAVGLMAALALAIPVLGADPSPSASPTAAVETDDPDGDEDAAAEKAEAAAEKAEADKEAKADGPELALTLKGTVNKTIDGKGRPTFTMTVSGVTWELSAGPKWFWGDNNPLAAFVGKSVAVAGTHHAGEMELDVDTVDGTAIRAAGKPPWAGGPKVVGKIHPGWKEWKLSGKPGNGHGRAGAPGQLKNKDKTTPD